MTKKNNVLIAEDEVVNYRYLNAVIRDGYDVLWAKNGKEAIDMVAANGNIALVLMDIKMPEMDGLEALKIIKELKPELPVVMQTAYAYDAERHEALSLGANGFVTKPIRVKTLLSLMQSLLSNV